MEGGKGMGKRVALSPAGTPLNLYTLLPALTHSRPQHPHPPVYVAHAFPTFRFELSYCTSDPST